MPVVPEATGLSAGPDMARPTEVPMKPVPVGTRVRVSREGGSHNYSLGSVVTVSRVDDDGTFKGIKPTGEEGNWLRWEHCDPAGPSLWEILSASLPDHTRLFLNAFEGVDQLSLRPKIGDEILRQLPDLQERIVSFMSSPAAAHLSPNTSSTTDNEAP